MDKISLDFLQMYAEPHRTYHGVAHPVKMLNFMVRNKSSLGVPSLATPIDKMLFRRDKLLVRYAVLAHDCVYDPTKSDNEEQSALVWQQYMKGHPLSNSVSVTRVTQLVLDSKKHIPNQTDFAQIAFLSLDLMELAADWEQFNFNTDEIRKEYKHVPEDAWIEGRTKFFESMLERPIIYGRQDIFGEWESRARKNIEQGIKELG
jgi:predicted metal-dependent HD superfamily phosphohydrolase